MKNARMTICWVMIVVAFGLVQSTFANIVYDNGQVNELNGNTAEYIYVRNNFFNQPTTLNITGGNHSSPTTTIAYTLYVEETSHGALHDGILVGFYYDSG